MRFTRTREILAATCVAMSLLIIGCGGGSGITPPPPPPPVPETLSMSVSVPASALQTYQAYPMAPVAISISASSNKGSVTTTCTVDGNTSPCSGNINLTVGTHNICGSALSVTTGMTDSKCASVVVSQLKLAGKAVGLDANGNEYNPLGSWVVIGPDNGTRDSTQVGTGGTFTINTRYANAGNVPVDFRGDGVLKLSRVRTSAEFFGTPTVIMTPKLYNTPSCATTGPSRAIAIDLEKAYKTPIPVDGPFGTGVDNIPFFIRKVVNGSWVYAVGSWKSWPVKVAFASAISAYDSAGYWTMVDSLNRAMCTPVFAPAKISEVNQAGGISVNLDPNGGVNGMVGELYKGDYVSGAENFSSPAVVFHPPLFTGPPHEGVHNLGIGHTCSWMSLMYYGCGTSRDNSILPEDVAYILLMQKIRALERKYNTRFSLAWSHQGERIAKGLPEEPVIYVREDGGFGSVSNPSGGVVILP